MKKLHIIFTIENIEKSKMFYKILFDLEPVIDEENIVEFELNENMIIGLQTEELPNKLFDDEIYSKLKSNIGNGAELYIECNNAEEMHNKALQLGCLELSPYQKRSWGHKAAYSVNHDGHILAFAKD